MDMKKAKLSGEKKCGKKQVVAVVVYVVVVVVVVVAVVVVVVVVSGGGGGYLARSRLKIYNSGVLQGEQGTHQSFLFLNKQGKKQEKKIELFMKSGDGRQENAPLGKVFHCQRSFPA